MMRALLTGLIAVVAGASAAQDDILSRHETCALDGRTSAVCAEVLTGYCLDSSGNIRELTRCRAGLARDLETKAQDLAAQLAARTPRLRTSAAEILAGSDRIVADYCASFGGRMAAEGSAGHDIRCALMAGHVKVYHLLRLSQGIEEDI